MRTRTLNPPTPQRPTTASVEPYTDGPAGAVVDLELADLEPATGPQLLTHRDPLTAAGAPNVTGGSTVSFSPPFGGDAVLYLKTTTPPPPPPGNGTGLWAEYFDTMEWYKPDPAFTEKRLTKIDVTNVRIIKSVEETLGGPLTEDEQRAEDNMSGF